MGALGADISHCNRHVRFTPGSGHLWWRLACPLWTPSRHTRLFDWLWLSHDLIWSETSLQLNAFRSRNLAKRDLGMIKKIERYPELADPQLQPRYSGIPTFFRLPHTVRLDEVDIGLVGVPFDGGVTNRPGARHGPRDIRNQSSLIRKINQATGVAPFDLVRVADLGDAWIERPFELRDALAEISAFFATVHAAGVTPLSVGGDHSISLPILRAIARDGPLGMVHVDAHCDTGDDHLGSRFHHGASFRRAVEEGLIDPKRVGHPRQPQRRRRSGAIVAIPILAHRIINRCGCDFR
jgi:Arginase family